MDKEKFIYYKDVEKLLDRNDFLKSSCRRGKNGRLTYTYRSIKYYSLVFSIAITKLDPQDIKSDKVVLGIKLNEKELNGWNDFIDALKNLKKLHNKEKAKLYVIV